MKKIKITLLLLSISLLSFSGYGQTQEFTDEASFLAALNGITPSMEDYTNCPEFADFTLTSIYGSGNHCRDYCNIFDADSYRWGDDAVFTFNSPQNAFGTYLIDIGDFLAVTVTLMTNNGQSEVHTILMESDGRQPDCNSIFFGIISDMDFDMVMIDNSNASENISFDNTFYAYFTPIPTLSQWGIMALGILTMIFGVVMIRQRKTIFARRIN